MSAALCPWCQAPRAQGESCPRCGANYAKAEAIRTQGRAVAAEAPLPEGKVFVYSDPADPEHRVDPGLEWKLCAAAIPGALVLAVLMQLALPGLQRIVFGMPLHELGHAATGWLCGFSAVPALWLTYIPEERGYIAPVALAGAMLYLGWCAWAAGKPLYVALCAAVLVAQGIGTFGIKLDTALMLVTFGGDALGMVLASALMASFFFGKGTQLYRGSLRWGFVVIGAAAFVDMFATWWAARSDFGRIPFGEQERAGPSDATKLVDIHGWTADQLIQRYVMVGVLCLAALALVYAWGVWRARRYAAGEQPR